MVVRRVERLSLLSLEPLCKLSEVTLDDGRDAVLENLALFPSPLAGFTCLRPRLAFVGVPSSSSDELSILKARIAAIALRFGLLRCVVGRSVE